VTTTLMLNSFTVGTEGGGGGGVVRGVVVDSPVGFELSLKIRAAATLMPPASIAKIASAASNLRRLWHQLPLSPKHPYPRNVGVPEYGTCSSVNIESCNSIAVGSVRRVRQRAPYRDLAAASF